MVRCGGWSRGWVYSRISGKEATEPFDVSGIPINGASTGRDGDIQAGVPFPSPRFTDNANGTVTDNLTGLIWLKNASCSTISPAVWATALSNANSLANGQCGPTDGSVAGDWRLPNVKELQSLIDFGFFNPALSNAAGMAKWTEGDAFSGVQSAVYWSSTTNADNPDNAWNVNLNDGNTNDDNKDNTNLVWPVRGGA
jgi:Protein of unknown function (DUF1566)